MDGRVEKGLVLGAVLVSLFAVAVFASEEGIQDLVDYPEARQFVRERKWPEAVIALRSIYKKRNSFPVLLDLVRSLAYSGRREEALSLLNEAESRETKGPRHEILVNRVKVLSTMFLSAPNFQTYQEGLNLVQARKFRAARERFEKALELEPDNLEILIRIGQCLLLDGDLDSAAERLRLARKLNPHEPEVRLWLGRAMHLRGETREAAEELKFAFRLLPDSERAPVWYSEYLLVAGQKNLAIQILEEDLAKNPYHLSTLIHLSRVRANGAGRDLAPLWAARKDLQLVASRMPSYLSPQSSRFEGELGLEFRLFPELLKEEVSKLSEEIEQRIENGRTDKDSDSN